MATLNLPAVGDSAWGTKLNTEIQGLEDRKFEKTGGTVNGPIAHTGTTLGFYSAPAVAKAAALTASAAAAPAGGVGSAAGGWDTAANRDAAIATINNLRTRLNELEARLQAYGLL